MTCLIHYRWSVALTWPTYLFVWTAKLISIMILMLLERAWRIHWQIILCYASNIGTNITSNNRSVVHGWVSNIAGLTRATWWMVSSLRVRSWLRRSIVKSWVLLRICLARTWSNVILFSTSMYATELSRRTFIVIVVCTALNSEISLMSCVGSWV
jgi:hypothetical protein